jgi:hypothetical protein
MVSTPGGGDAPQRKIIDKQGAHHESGEGREPAADGARRHAAKDFAKAKILSATKLRAR